MLRVCLGVLVVWGLSVCLGVRPCVGVCAGVCHCVSVDIVWVGVPWCLPVSRYKGVLLLCILVSGCLCLM